MLNESHKIHCYSLKSSFPQMFAHLELSSSSAKSKQKYYPLVLDNYIHLHENINATMQIKRKLVSLLHRAIISSVVKFVSDGKTFARN